MILDASALIAIALDEPERKILVAKINAAELVAVGAPTLAEAGIVVAEEISVIPDIVKEKLGARV